MRQYFSKHSLLLMLLGMGQVPIFLAIALYSDILGGLSTERLFFVYLGEGMFRLQAQFYFPVALGIYIVWFIMQFTILKIFAAIDFNKFVKSKINGSLHISLIGFAHHFIWMIGIELTLWAVYFLLPLIGLSLLSFIIFCIQTYRAIKGKYA